MAEKKPRAAKATKKTETTKKTTTAKAKAEPTSPKTVRARKPKALTATVVAVTPEMIAERAYYIWADGSDGDAFAHWVQAEQELTAA